jgi:catechol-2,3-dioxygenase
VIELERLHHVCLGVDLAAGVEAAAARWSARFGLAVRSAEPGRALRACDDEPYALELVPAAADEAPGHRHTAWELARGCSLADAARHLGDRGVEHEERAGALWLADPDGNVLELLPSSRPDGPPAPTAHVRPAGAAILGHPRRLGHVNFLTGRLEEQIGFYADVLGMRVSDRLGDGGAWLRVEPEHHQLAFVDKGSPHLHHLAFDVVDIGQMRTTLDHLGRHGLWLGWGPTRHGIAGNVASYVRICEEPLFVELYCDMEILRPDHEARTYPDDRYSSNTWGPLPPRSYFRFDEAAVASERASLETLGTPLEPLPHPESLETR